MKYFSISETAKLIGVSTDTLRRWDNEGRFSPKTKTKGRHRRYTQEQVDEFLGEDTNNSTETNVVIYARVSTRKQKESGNLDSQKSRLTEYCIKRDYKIVDIYQEVAIGINENRRQMHKMLDGLDNVDKIVIEYKDRLARFGFKYIEKVANAYNVEIEIIEKKDNKSLDEEMVQDLISIITSFSARIYGARGGKKVKKILKELDEEGASNEDNN